MNFLIFNRVAALIWQEKKGEKKIAINSFQKKSIISIMKKEAKLLQSSEKKRKMKKDTIKNTSLLSNEKKV